VHLPAGVKVSAVAAGQDFSLALTTTHDMLAWGDNGVNELGDGSDNSSLVPVHVEAVDFTATSIGAGPSSSSGLAIGTQLPV
jgi:alpha-tubulin suppressor-like RCC1 family protein